MNLAEARRRGLGVRLVKSAPTPAPVPVSVHVTVENTELADALAALKPQVIEVTQNQEVAQAFMNALKQSHQAVIAAANKIPAHKVVESCDLEHEWVRGMPLVKSIKFNYKDA